MKNGIYKTRDAYAVSGTPCLRMYNIERGTIVWKNVKRMKLSETEIKEYRLLPGDVLINRVNSRELVGKAAVISSDLEVSVFESKNIRIRLATEIVDPSFICYVLCSSGQEYFSRNAQQVVGMASVSQRQIAAFPVPLPPLAEQRRIVKGVESQISVVRAVEVAVDRNLRRAEHLRQVILRRAIEGKLVPQDPKDEPADVLLHRIRTERAAEAVVASRRPVRPRRLARADTGAPIATTAASRQLE